MVPVRGEGVYYCRRWVIEETPEDWEFCIARVGEEINLEKNVVGKLSEEPWAEFPFRSDGVIPGKGVCPGVQVSPGM